MANEWKYYFPDGGETVDDARSFMKRAYRPPNDAEDAAQIACELDYSYHDGYERGEEHFKIGVVAPDGEVHIFNAWHEPSVEHNVSEAL